MSEDIFFIKHGINKGNFLVNPVFDDVNNTSPSEAEQLTSNSSSGIRQRTSVALIADL